MALLTADWTPLGEVFYRKLELYSMGWSDQVDLSKFIVAATPYGGPVALIRDDRKHTAGSVHPKPIIYIFSAAGKEISSIKWNSGNVIQLGWSSTEELLCVQDDGTVLVYNLFGKFIRTFGMGNEAKETKVLQVKVFTSYQGTGIAVLTGTYRIFIVNNINELRIRRLAEVPALDTLPTCWAIISHERESRALVACGDRMFLLDHGGNYQEQTPDVSNEYTTFLEMAVSFNNKYLAFLTDTGMLWIGSSDLNKCYCEFNTKCQVPPKQLVWCGTGAVVGYWENTLLMVGPQKDYISLDSAVHLVPEVDGLRIVGNFTHELLQKVPPVVEDIFKIGSMEPGAILFEASKEFQKKSQKADEYIRMIKDRLDQAVDQCIKAAGEEYLASTQKSLLKAASFGKSFLTDLHPEPFVTMCQELRVLNAVRDHKIGIPLTYMQLKHLSLHVLIDRLVFRRQFCLAIRICQYLKLPEAEGTSRILAHWACDKVQQTNIDDETVARAIATKLGDTPGVSYSEIANRAIESGKTELAIRLLEYEPKAAEQVPLLMKIKNDRLALEKAIESGDTDLIYMVILHLRDTMKLGEFFMTIRSHPVAYSLFLQYCRGENKLKMLQDLYYQEDNFQEEGHCKLIDSYSEDRIDSRMSNLMAAHDAYNKAKNDWAAKQAEEQVRLLKYQRRLEEELNKPYMDRSLHQTIYHLTMDGNHKLAEQLKKEFKVPDKRFWWLKISALAEAGDWTELDRFHKSKKSPIGYEPFIDVCIKNNNKYEAQKFVLKVSPENKVRCYVKVGNLQEAAEVAFQQKSEEGLEFVYKRCGPMNRNLAEKILQMRSQLTGRK